MARSKPAAEWTAAEAAAAPYDLRTLEGPELTGAALAAFRALSEVGVTGELIFRVYERRNHLHAALHGGGGGGGAPVPEAPQASGVPAVPAAPEAGVVAVAGADAASPAARVKAALDALGVRADGTSSADNINHGRHGRSRNRRRPTILDYHAAYASGEVTPAAVADAVLAFLETERGAANWLCELHPDHVRAQAAAATRRYVAGAPLSVLDGVPFAVKDCVDALAHRSGGGTDFLGAARGPVRAAALEAPAVAALRSLGAMCLGKAQMHEFGLQPTGLSARLGLATNPHDLGRIAGGSSGGSACVVAAGVVPFAVGTDGGGSVRIPAALCGVVGFKPTQGRMASEPDGASLVTLGPIAATAADALIAYAAMACPGCCFRGPAALRQRAAAQVAKEAAVAAKPAGATTADEAQAEVDAAAAAVAAAAAAPPPPAVMGEDVAARPPLALPARVFPAGLRLGIGGDGGGSAATAGSAAMRALRAARPLAGLRVGVFAPWFDDADCCVAAAARAGVRALEALGARTVPIVIPELDTLRAAHAVLFLSESLALNRATTDDARLRGRLGDDTRTVLAMARRLAGGDYLQAQRLRRRGAAHWARAFESCDVIATPTTAVVADRVPAGAAGGGGVLNLAQCGRLVRFCQQANVLGLPAVTLPLGAVECGACGGGGGNCATGSGTKAAAATPAHLPRGLQLIGAPWRDATLLRVACVAEEALRAERLAAPAPALCLDPLLRAAGNASAAAATAAAAGGSPARGSKKRSVDGGLRSGEGTAQQRTKPATPRKRGGRAAAGGATPARARVHVCAE